MTGELVVALLRNAIFLLEDRAGLIWGIGHTAEEAWQNAPIAVASKACGTVVCRRATAEEAEAYR